MVTGQSSPTPSTDTSNTPDIALLNAIARVINARLDPPGEASLIGEDERVLREGIISVAGRFGHDETVLALRYLQQRPDLEQYAGQLMGWTGTLLKYVPKIVGECLAVFAA